MNIEKLIEDLREEGVLLWQESNKLKYRCENGQLPKATRSKLLDYKNSIINYLKENKNNIFSLSNLQQSYWLGEQSAFDFPAPAVVHLVYKTNDLEINRLEDALNAVMTKHPILRTYIDSKGILRPLKRFKTPIRILRNHSANAGQCKNIGRIKDWLPSLDIGPLFTLILAAGQDGQFLHALLRLIIFDSDSVNIFLNELRSAYNNIKSYSFAHTNSGNYEIITPKLNKLGIFKSKEYWQNKFVNLPSAPKLPMKSSVHKRREVYFFRLHGELSNETWEKLQKLTKKNNISTNVFLAYVYGLTLQRWSEQSKFVLNVMFSQRLRNSSNNINQIGNFSSTLLLEYNLPKGTLLKQMRYLQTTLYEAMTYSAYDAVAVLRLLTKKRLNEYNSTPAQPLFPVVFSSLIDGSHNKNKERGDCDWPMIDSVMSTPQVLLDHQVYECDGKLAFNWDFVEDVFEDRIINDAFLYYKKLLNTLGTNDQLWHYDILPQLPNNLLEARIAANCTTRKHSPRLLHEGLFRRALQNPSLPAIAYDNKTLTFRETASGSIQFAEFLIKSGLKPGQRVLINGRKRPETIMAIYAVLLVGAVYVPTSVKFPIGRIKYIAKHANVSMVLSDNMEVIKTLQEENYSVMSMLSIMKSVNLSCSIEFPASTINPTSSAYIIYTSGSTGNPKGVEISHAAAFNTIVDVLDRFEITENDRLLGISEFSFDLSVFDLFSIALGGTCLVLPQESEIPDPSFWLEAASRHGVTIWNSVPAIMEMAVKYLKLPQGIAFRSNKKNRDSLKIRLFLASGDWIPVYLPDLIKEILPDSNFISLGGATEAAIWSNYYVVNTVQPQWQSIPYGFPLSNQRFYIFDENGFHAPPLVVGELYIAGEGLAKGYYNDPKITAESFFYSKEAKDRVYRTGDLGRYMINGCIEFIGRRDHQVKILGNRIELGEIENTILSHSSVEFANVLLHKQDQDSESSLVAVIKWTSSNKVKSELINYISNLLPDYMIPKHFVEIESLPLTGNGKIDRTALEKYIQNFLSKNTQVPLETSMTVMEKRICELWKKVLKINSFSKNTSFFYLGGDSLKAIQLLNFINEEFSCSFSLSDIFKADTIPKQAELFKYTSREPDSLIFNFTQNSSASINLFLIHPVGGSAMCYNSISKLIDPMFNIYGISADEDSHLDNLSQMAEQYAEKINLITGDSDVVLGGWSMGGIIALETAHVLECSGFNVSKVFTIDSMISESPKSHIKVNLKTLALLFISDLAGFVETPEFIVDKDSFSLDDLWTYAKNINWLPNNLDTVVLSKRFELFRRNYLNLLNHELRFPKCTTNLIQASDTKYFPGLCPLNNTIPTPSQRIITVYGNHYTIMNSPNNVSLAEQINEILSRI